MLKRAFLVAKKVYTALNTIRSFESNSLANLDLLRGIDYSKLKF